MRTEDCAFIAQLNWMGEGVRHQPRQPARNLNAEVVPRKADDDSDMPDQEVVAIFGDDSELAEMFSGTAAFDLIGFDRLIGFRPADFNNEVQEGDLFVIESKTYQVTDGPHDDDQKVHGFAGLDLRGGG